MNYICNGKRYTLGGPKRDTIGLPVTLSKLPKKINIEDETLYVKDSFHVSLVCIGKIIEKKNVSIPHFMSKVVEDFCVFTSKTEIGVEQFLNDFRFVSQGDRKSLISMCKISNLNKFFDFLNKKYNLSLEYPPTHITLYTLQPNLGIFVTDTKDLENLTKKVVLSKTFNFIAE